MSTDYTLASIGPVELFCCERSGKIEFGIIREDLLDDRNYLDTGALFDSDDILDIIVKLLAVASYVSEDPETVVARLLIGIKSDRLSTIDAVDFDPLTKFSIINLLYPP